METMRSSYFDLANGQLRPQYKILRDQGHRVYGVDTVNLPKRGWRDCAYRIARRFYAKDVSANYSKRDDTLICGDVSALPFRNQSFDLVTSVAAFEHFLDVPSVLQEDSIGTTRRGTDMGTRAFIFLSFRGAQRLPVTGSTP